jgi:hypothetical protein
MTERLKLFRVPVKRRSQSIDFSPKRILFILFDPLAKVDA